MNNIRKYRKKKKMSAADLAKFVGVSRQMVYLWETDVCVPKLTNAIKIARALNISIEDIL